MSKELTIAGNVPATVKSLTTVPDASVTWKEMRADHNTYPLIADTPKEVAIAAFQVIIYKAMFNAAPGTFAEDETDERIALMAAELYDLVLADYNNLGTRRLSFAELARVIRRASVSRDLYGVSVRTLYAAVEEYCLNEGHKAFKELQAEKWRDRRLTPPPTAPAEEATAAQVDAAQAAMARLASKMNINGKF